MLYFIKGLHVREFGFPRIPNSDGGKSNHKPYKWKKTNFMTDLPKHSPAVRYLVAHTNNQQSKFRMHASVLPQEYDPRYKKSYELQKMRGNKVKLLEEDINPSPNHERIICCHIKDMD